MTKRLLLFAFSLLLLPAAWSQVVWEDFEGGAQLNWNAIEGTYNGAIANPDMSGVNTSATMGSYTKSDQSSFSLFLAELAEPIDMAANPIWKIQLWSPVQVDFLLKLEGTGEAIEGRKTVVNDSTWVEYTFDFRGAANLTTINKIILFFDPGNADSGDTYFFDNLTSGAVPAASIFEDFEEGGKNMWTGINGTFDGIIQNPEDTTGANPSANVGSHTKASGQAFSFSLTETAQPLDFGILNQVSVQVYAGAKTAMLFKLEGPGVTPIEKRSNIPAANTWRTYNFDFSELAGVVGYTKVLLFFDPGTDESEDTYLFDNIIFSPAGECAGTVPDPFIVDDFECQRNATYDNGFNLLSAIDNPDVSEGNMSSTVGQFTKPPVRFSLILADYESAIDLSENNQATAKIWAPVGGQMLFKLERGASPAREVFVDIPATGEWVTLTADFSEFALENHNALGIFFGADAEQPDTTIWYIDDISWGKKEAPGPIEDFEEGGRLFWEAQGGNMDLNGDFQIIPNPDMSGLNTSDNVGEYVRGSSDQSTVEAILNEPLDFSEFTQFNMLVWAPEGAQSVEVLLGSPTQGLKSKTATVEETGVWVNLGFDYSEFANITDFDQLLIRFDPGSTAMSTWYFDDIRVGESTVDPCAGVEPIANIVDDFECQRNVTIGVGAGDISAVINPDISPGNSSTIVGEYVEPAGAFAAMVYDYGEGNPIDLSLENELNVKVWAPRVVPLLFKLEGGTGAPVEFFIDVPEANTWVQYAVDFRDAIEAGHTRLAIFFNAGNDEMLGEIYYIDDVLWKQAPFTECIVNYEEDAFSLTGWTGFANGPLTDSMFTLVENPDKSGINTSDFVGEFLESGTADGAEIFAGMFAPLANYIDFPSDNFQLSAKVWMPTAGRVALKVERSLNGAPNSGDVFADYTTPGEWQELTWDYSTSPAEVDGQYGLLTIIMNFDNVPAELQKHYFDDIKITGTSCDEGTVSVFTPEYKDLSIYPNPTSDMLVVENAVDLDQFRIYNLLGQEVMIFQTSRQSTVSFSVADLHAGVYMLLALDEDGQPQAKSKFVKN